MSAATLALAEGYVSVKPRGPVPVKGLAEPVEVFELTGAGVARTRLQAAATRGLTKFVGRDAEVDQLNRALERAGAGHGQIVAVVGEPGVGKSRLFHEFTHSHRLREWSVLESGSVSYGKATSYLPVIDLLKSYCRINDRDTHRDIREKVAGKIVILDESLKPLLPALLSLLDVPAQDEEWERLDPPYRRQRTLDACKRLLLRESQVQSLGAGVRGSALDRHRDPGVSGQPDREPALRAYPVAGQLSSGVCASLGDKELLHSNSASIRCRPSPPKRCSSRCSVARLS